MVEAHLASLTSGRGTGPRNWALAGSEAARLLGPSPAAWERWVYTFAAAGKLAELVDSLPVAAGVQSGRMSPEVYEMVLGTVLLSGRPGSLCRPA